MVIAKQLMLFLFDYEDKMNKPTRLEEYDGNHHTVAGMDAQATVEYLNRMPSRKGSWWRCLIIDHERSYNSDWKYWDISIWIQRGIGLKKAAKYSKDVMDLIDPHPDMWYYLNDKYVQTLELDTDSNIELDVLLHNMCKERMD